MNEERAIRINTLAELLWDDASDDWHPESVWMDILAPHCNDDPSLSTEVRDFVRASNNENLVVNAHLAILPFEKEDVRIPKQIGAYRILSVLGAGGMGVVYAAQFQGEGMEPRPVAVKVSKDSAQADAVMRRLRAEINLLSRLHHPNVVQIYDAGTTKEGSPYLVMELVDGGKKISEYCEANAVALSERIQLFQRICSAVSYLHKENIVHRDLTTGNILVNLHGEASLIDFGLAVFLKPVEGAPSYANSEVTPRRLGTPGYMSPEQARGEQGRASDDVWALGAILELLIANPPLNSPGATRLRTALQRVITHCHEPELHQRIQSVEILTELVNDAVDDANAHPATRILKLARSRRGRVIAAVAALAVFSLGGWRYQQYRHEVAARERAAANRRRADELHEKLVDLKTDEAKVPFEQMFTPLTNRTGPLEIQVEYTRQLANAGDAMAKHVFGIAMLACRGSTLAAQEEWKMTPQEQRPRLSPLISIDDQTDIVQRVFQSVLAICSESDAHQAFTWLEEVASNGQAMAAAFLTEILHEGGKEIPKNPSQTLRWARKAIEGGHPQGYRVLGQLYFEGQVLPRNYELAIENWEKAARYGDILGQYQMALIFKGGSPPRWPINHAEAYKWSLLSSANNQGLLIGLKYTPPAIFQYEALRQKAIQLRTELEKELTPAQQDEVQRQAVQWKPLTFHPSTMKFSLEEHEAIRKAVLGDEPVAKDNAK